MLHATKNFREAKKRVRKYEKMRKIQNTMAQWIAHVHHSNAMTTIIIAVAVLALSYFCPLLFHALIFPSPPFRCTLNSKFCTARMNLGFCTLNERLVRDGEIHVIIQMKL